MPQDDGAFVEADDRLSRIQFTGVPVEHVLHAGDELLADGGDAPHLFPSRLEAMVCKRDTCSLAAEPRRDPSSDGLRRNQTHGPANAAVRR